MKDLVELDKARKDGTIKQRFRELVLRETETITPGEI
jgi:hypothetical protein